MLTDPRDLSLERQVHRLHPERVVDEATLAVFLSAFTADLTRQPTHEFNSLALQQNGKDLQINGYLMVPAAWQALEFHLGKTALKSSPKVVPNSTVNGSVESTCRWNHCTQVWKGHQLPRPESPVLHVFNPGDWLEVLIDQASWSLCRTECGYLCWIDQFNEPLVGVHKISSVLSEETIENHTRPWLGVPYVWGGNNIHGCDCSGFVQTIYRELGYCLPRDAHQQMLSGLLVADTSDAQPPQAGDLLFFTHADGRIGHVGLSLSGWRMIHAEEPIVSICSLNPNDPDYNPWRKAHFAFAKRMLIR